MTMQPLGNDLFVVDGPVVRDMGMPFETRMTVARLRDGSVWIASPVPVSHDTLAGIVALGPVRHLVSPTPRHIWRLEPFHTLFPEAELWSSPLTPVTLGKPDLPIAGILGDEAPAAWASDLDQVLVRGSRWLAEVVFLHTESRTLLVEDLIQVHQRRPGRPLYNALIAWGGVTGPRGGVARDIRLSFRDREAARRSVARVLEWDFDQIVLAHGPVVSQAPREMVQEAFAWLEGKRQHDQ